MSELKAEPPGSLIPGIRFAPGETCVVLRNETFEVIYDILYKRSYMEVPSRDPCGERAT